MPEWFASHGARRAENEFVSRHVRPEKVDATTGERKTRSSTALGYGYRWQKFRLWFLKKHPLCRACEKEGRVEPATELDHIVPHKGDMVLFWDVNNLQGLCEKHHSKKTATEDGGFGNSQRKATS